MAHRQPGLARARRALGENEFVLFQKAQIEILRRVARPHHAALAGAHMLEDAARRLRSLVLGKQRALQRAFLDGAVHIAQGDGLPMPHALVENFEHSPRLFAGLGRALDDDVIAIGDRRDFQPSLDLGEVLVIEAEDQSSQAIVLEGEGDLAGVGVALDARPWRRFTSDGDWLPQ